MRTAFSACAVCVQGAAFDLPQESANALLAKEEELTKRKFEMTKPTALPLQEGRGYVSKKDQSAELVTLLGRTCIDDPKRSAVYHNNKCIAKICNCHGCCTAQQYP